MEWLSLTQQVVTLIIGLVGLIGTGVGVFTTIKAIIKNHKNMSLADAWKNIQALADVAMQEAEKSAEKGASKKQIVMDAVNKAAEAAGVDIKPFTSQLSAYIDDTINFVNKMHK